MLELNNFDSIKIGLASPEQIREWSKGEVKKPETINYRTLKPEREGLFCEKIFGPTRDWECHCGKYKRVRYKGIICDRCGVEVTRSKVRRERLGHIELAASVSHIWYFKGIPSRIGLLLDMSPRSLERVLYFAAYIVTDPGSNTSLVKKQLLSEAEYRESREKYGNAFKAGMGAEFVRVLLAEIDLDKLSNELRKELREVTGQRKVRAIRRLEVVEAFRKSETRPEWMILDVIPVIPPELRPMVQLDGGRFATSDLNDLYRRVINRNNRLKRLLDLGAPDIIVRNEKRMLQEAVDALIDNGRRGRPVTGPGNRPLKSLSDMLKGKQGRFRQNLLGKRVDYSGRSVIVVGPRLKLHQCGLPKEMALELFKPFVMKQLVKQNLAHNIKSAKRMVERVRPEVWDVLEDVIKEHPVLLNRAPTLHRLGIQSFEPVLVEGRAIQIHPLVCTAYNADFDGDQMAVHVPLSAEAQAEARILMLSTHNILNPKDGKPVTTPTQDMVIGCYYLTLAEDEHVPKLGALASMDYVHPETGEIMVAKDERLNMETLERLAAAGIQVDVKSIPFFTSTAEALMAYANHDISLHQHLMVVYEGANKHTTVGRLIFNEVLPPELRYVNRAVDKKALGNIISESFRLFGSVLTAKVLDGIKELGFKYATQAGITIAVTDIKVPEEKVGILAEADADVEQIEYQHRRGLINDDERYNKVVQVWTKATEDVTEALKDSFDRFNPVYMMATSGARGNIQQIRQLAGMRGLMADPSGRIIDVPIKANFREGLTVLEYFTSTHGARKGLADTALRTADSGYLTRRLVDVAQDVIVREEDCGTTNGIMVSEIKDGSETIESFYDRIVGRICLDDILAPEGSYTPKPVVTPYEAFYEDNLGKVSQSDWTHPATGELIMEVGDRYTEDTIKLLDEAGLLPEPPEDENAYIIRANQEITENIAKKIVDASIKEVRIRSVLTCRSRYGICIKCYGRNLATGGIVEIGEAVGIVAAQSIGEPGTQLTMRTFHTGGVAGDDITQGLPRVEELFEARKPKGQAIISEVYGQIHIGENKGRVEIEVRTENNENNRAYMVPYGARMVPEIKEGSYVDAGSELTEGSINPHDLLKIKGLRGVQMYLLDEVQKVYRLQGVDINDKHIEVMVRQMLRKVKVEDPGDTDLLPGGLVDIFDFEEENARVIANDGLPAAAKPILLGITKASLATDSFLSAASFQETTRVLTEAAIKGKIDPLLGLKENVIIGKLIPAGTGMSRYRNIRLKPH